MTKKTRFIILLICAVLFLIITPYIVLYSLGYRIDFAERKIIATGGIYVRALPSGADIIIDYKIKNKTGFFSNAIFVQNLLPKLHNVFIKKTGYYDYQKSILVKEKEVTKLENVILFKQNILFDLLENGVDYFSTAPDNNTLLVKKTESNTANKNKINFEVINLTTKEKQNFSLIIKTLAKNEKIQFANWLIQWSNDSNKALLNIKDDYFLLDFSLREPKITNLAFLSGLKEPSFNPDNSDQIFFVKNKNLYLNSKEPILILKNVISYQIIPITSGIPEQVGIYQNITWFSDDGFLYGSDIEGKRINKISLQNFSIKKDSSYKITNVSSKIFLQEDDSLFLLNENLKIFEKFHSPVKTFKISPDKQKILYFNNNEIFYSFLGSMNQNILLSKSPEKINDYYWLNNDYLIFNSGNKTTISEINNKDNINTVTLSQVISLPDGKNIDIQKPKIFFNQQDKKLYILTKDSLLVSEKLIP